MRWGRAERGAARGESGQATVEWVGLVLAVALALGALAGGVRGAARGESAAGLGEAVAQRITCGVRDACGAGGRPLRGTPLGARDAAPGARDAAPGDFGAPPARGTPTTGLGGVPPSAPWQRPPRGVPGIGAVPGAGRAGAVARRAWIVCFAYRRWRSEVEHPRGPREALPVDETLGILNDCLNPWAFFFG